MQAYALIGTLQSSAQANATDAVSAERCSWRPSRSRMLAAASAITCCVVFAAHQNRKTTGPLATTLDPLWKPYRLYNASAPGCLPMPSRADQYRGVEDKRPVDVFEKDGTASIFVIGDWGATMPNHVTFGTCDDCGHDKFAQISVAGAMKARAKWADPQYVLNVGDNFYISGLELSCNAPPNVNVGATAATFSSVWQQMYGPVANKPWLSVLGNHDYGGWQMDKGWPQQIGYSFINHNWIMPARYFSKRISHSDFAVDYFMLDSNAFDAKNPDLSDDHNICSGKHNVGGVGTCASNGGMTTIQDCMPWFWRTYKEQKAWLEEKIAASDARWKIVVTHFPCGYDGAFYKMLKRKYGLDLLVTGHRHQQELWSPDTSSRYIQSFMRTNAWDETAPACFVTGGGGGISSQHFSYADYGADLQNYGFFHLIINKDRIKILLIGADGQEHGNSTIYPHGTKAAEDQAKLHAKKVKAWQKKPPGLCSSYCGDMNNPWDKVCEWMSCSGCKGCSPSAEEKKVTRDHGQDEERKRHPTAGQKHEAAHQKGEDEKEATRDNEEDGKKDIGEGREEDAHEVASLSSASTDYYAFQSGACRGNSPSHNPTSWYSVAQGFRGHLTDCQDLCTAHADCKALEFAVRGPTAPRCELWHNEPQATSGNQDWTCMKRSELHAHIVSV